MLPDGVWLNDIGRWLVKGSLWGLAIGTTAAILVGYGEHRMSALALDAIGDADWCMAQIRPILEGAERAAWEADKAALALSSYMDTPAPLAVDLVAEALQ